MGHPVWGAGAPEFGGRDTFSHFGNSSEVSTEAELRLASNPEIPFLVLQPMHPYFQRETPTRILTVALFLTAPAAQLPLNGRMEKQTVCVWGGGGLTMKYYTAMKKNCLALHSTVWKKLINVVSGEER